VLKRTPAPACPSAAARICAASNQNKQEHILCSKPGILNPQINSLLSRVRHTNTLVIADRGFPFWPTIETVDISLVDDVPTVLAVLCALRGNFHIGKAWMTRGVFKTEQRQDPICVCQGVARNRVDP